MWTYKAGQEKAAPEKISPIQKQPAEAWGRSTGAQSKAASDPPAVIPKAGRLPVAAGKYRLLFGAAYLAGLLAGSLALGLLGQDAAEYANLYRDARLELFCTATPLQLFSGQFLAAFLQLSLTALCGLCAIGVPFLVLLLMVRGAAFGCFCAALLAEHQAGGALILAVLFWLPEVFGALLQVLLSVWAMRSALQIGMLCFGKNSHRRLETPRRLLNAYLTLCLCSLLPCFLSAILALLFGPLIGG